MFITEELMDMYRREIKGTAMGYWRVKDGLQGCFRALDAGKQWEYRDFFFIGLYVSVGVIFEFFCFGSIADV